MSSAPPPSVRVLLNGEDAAVPEGERLLAMLERLGIRPGQVVVEHNQRIVRAPDLNAVVLSTGDEIEVVHFVGGG